MPGGAVAPGRSIVAIQTAIVLGDPTKPGVYVQQPRFAKDEDVVIEVTGIGPSGSVRVP